MAEKDFMNYNHQDIEKKWRAVWKDSQLYRTSDDSAKEKFYVLDMFPYPSGEGLHVGHPKGYIATDIISRKQMMQGKNVLHPMGWDAFGLPAENYAIKHKIHPSAAVSENIIRFKEQIEKIGCTYDWEREINTTDPSYYKWTQWIFLQMFKKGLAFESFEPINWCPSCKTGLANEDLEDGRCERCGSVVEKKPLRQWVLRITDYAERLLTDLEPLDWPEAIKESQRHWIGKSEGAELDFTIADSEEKITVFTTRPDTLFGVTYVVLAPEHALVSVLKNRIDNFEAVERYIEAIKSKPEIERTAEGKEKSGIALEGIEAINPINGEKIPVWIADYVLADYGTGAVMAVPAHDDRDFAFATKYDLPIRTVVRGDQDEETQNGAYIKEGVLSDSDNFNGRDSAEVKQDITKAAGGHWVIKYKLRDWVFSRQRYWGEPIPLIHCADCGVVPVSENELPVRLPDVESYEPTGTGESPLAGISEWVNTVCPKCGGAGKRETNTMPQWAGSSWYYLRYIDPNNDNALVDPKKEAYWSPIDLYVGGAEQVTRHMIYARFWHKFLFDIGAVSGSEPFARYSNLGLILGEDGRKMSKRWGNVINPDVMVESYGADAFRLYEMFIGPFTQPASFKESGVAGARAFLGRVFNVQSRIMANADDSAVISLLHKTIKKVGEDIDALRFNTAVSSLMILTNACADLESLTDTSYDILLRLLAPFAPHICEELWHRQDQNRQSIFKNDWPTYDTALLVDEIVTIAVQVNGKVRETFEIESDANEESVKERALALPKILQWIDGKEIIKVVVIKGKIVNVVIKE